MIWMVFSLPHFCVGDELRFVGFWKNVTLLRLKPESGILSFFSKGLSVLGRLALLSALLAAFLAGVAGVVFMSLSGSEIKVPEIVGKDFYESEKELEALGLKIKKRAERPSQEQINTVLEQLPRPGETVKTGQMILVVVSKYASAGEDAPKSLIQDIQADDTEKIEEMISDKPKRSRSNSNANANAEKATVDTNRDITANTTANTATASGGETPAKTDDAAAKEPAANTSNRSNRAMPGDVIIRIPAPKATPQPSGGETRPRAVNRP